MYDTRTVLIVARRTMDRSLLVVQHYKQLCVGAFYCLMMTELPFHNFHEILSPTTNTNSHEKNGGKQTTNLSSTDI